MRSGADDDLRAMGFELVSYTVTSVDDENGYMQALGATQTALVKREAAEGKARNEAEARKQVAFYNAEADSQVSFFFCFLFFFGCKRPSKMSERASE